MSKTEEDIFCDALDVPISDRKNFVREACDGDHELRTSVERLLQLHDTEDGFLATPAIGLKASEVEEQPGDLIGSFRLEKIIGEGGFGIVWQAEQLEPVKRKVAVKIFKLGMDSRQVLRRFNKERQTLAIMSHPNIATVLDAGTTHRGRSFFAMELVEGKSIDRYCLEKRLSVSQQLQLVTDVCRAVQHAHQKGVVHLDLKPSNILVAEQDGHSFIKIIDFGIAKAVQNVGPEFRVDMESRETNANFQLVGTPEYMSPEQVDSPNEVDTRSDIYSLGAVLYKLLTGKPPLDFSGIENPKGLGSCIRESIPLSPSQQLRKQVLSSEHRNSRVLNSAVEIQRGLDCITMKALQKAPENRYPSAFELARDIERFLCNQVVSAVPWKLSYALQQFFRRNRLLVIASGLVILATVGGLIAMSVGLIQADRQHAKAERSRILAVQEAEEARLVASLLEQLIGGANPEAGLPANFSLREQLDEFAASINDKLEKYPEVEARLRHVIGRAYSNLRVLEKAGPHLRRALELRLQTFAADHPLVLESRLELARFLVFDAKSIEARTQVELVLEDLKTSEPSLALAKAHHVLSEINSNGGLALETFLCAEKAWQIAEAAAGANDLLTLDYQSRAGFCAIRVETLERAEKLSSDALKGLQKHWPDRTFEINRAKGRLVTVLTMQKKFEEALPLINQVIEENSSQLGSESHFHVTAMLSKVSILRRLDRRDEAEELLWKASEVADRATNERSRAQTMAYRRLAEWVQRDGRLTEAEALWAKATDARKRMDGNTHRVSQELTIRGFLLRELGRNHEAEQCLAEAVNVLRSLPKPKKNIFLEALLHQADQKLELGLADEALEPLEEAVEMVGTIVHPTVYPHIDYIQGLLMSNKTEKARQHAKAWADLSQENSDEVLAVIAQIARAQVAMSTHEFEPASEQLAESAHRLQAQPDNKKSIRRLMTRVNELLAECYLEAGKFQVAEDILLPAAEESQQTADRMNSRRARRLLVSLYRTWGQLERAAFWEKRLHQQW